MRARLALACAAAAAGTVLLLPAAASAKGPVVAVADLTGAVDPLAARYVERAIEQAEATPAIAALVVRIDTPGGLDSSMRRIVRGILDARVPVICWVGPAGARAASAGAFVLTACHLAAMADGTNAGAAHPVGFRGEVLDAKITNDAAAYIRAIAERTGRNPDWAERAVRESVSVSAREALSLDAIELIANDLESLLRAADGRTVQVSGRGATLATSGAATSRVEMTFLESVLHGAVDPNLAFLLLIVGMLGIAFEIATPGLTVPGVLGGLSLIAALVILGMLPVNVAGLLLIVAAIGLFAVDLQVAGHGLATAGGIASLVAGGLFLFDRSVPAAAVSKGLIVGTAAAVALFFAVVARSVVRSQRQRPGAGLEAMIGEPGTAQSDLAPGGVVQARGEEWTAHAHSGAIAAGTPVRVVGVRGLTLEVEAAGAAVAPEPGKGESP